MQKNAIKEADLLETLSFILPLPAPFQSRVNEEVINENFGRKHLLLRPGEISRKLYFIRSGFLRAFFLDEHGKQCTTWFMGKGELMISVYSFFTQKPAFEHIEVLQDCKLQSISWQQLNAYYADFPVGNLLGRIVMQKYYMMSEERAIFLRTQTPNLRYDKLLELHPDIEQQTSQNNIASYLGISRETLSRIRRKKRDMCHQTQNGQNSASIFH
jgi:CRP-like cAMP-binding protein